MSEFKCAEPGCDYHVGISNGPNLTPDDWESEDYYFREIEEHQRMHEAQKSEEAKVSAVNFVLKLDQAIKEAEANFEAAKEKLNSVAQKIAFEIAVGGDLQGPRYDYLLARDSYATSQSALGTLRKLKKAVSSAQTGEDSADEGNLEGRVPRVEADRRSRGNEQGSGVSVSVLDLDSRDTVLLESINNFLLDIRQILVRQIDGSPVVTDMSHEVSLSVDGAPRGAGVGTSDSTERGKTPDSPEMKVPSAVAAAEGDETNNPKR